MSVQRTLHPAAVSPPSASVSSPIPDPSLSFSSSGIAAASPARPRLRPAKWPHLPSEAECQAKWARLYRLLDGDRERQRKLEKVMTLAAVVKEKEEVVAVQVQRIQQLRTAIEFGLMTRAKKGLGSAVRGGGKGKEREVPADASAGAGVGVEAGASVGPGRQSSEENDLWEVEESLEIQPEGTKTAAPSTHAAAKTTNMTKRFVSRLGSPANPKLITRTVTRREPEERAQ